MPQRQQRQRRAQRHPEILALGLVAQRAHFVRRDAIQRGVHLLQRRLVAGAEETPAGDARDVAQGVEIHPVLAAGGGVADTDGVHHDPMLRGQLGRARRRHGAGRVIAVGQQDQYLVALPGVVQHADAQADGVAQRGVGSGHAHRRALQQQAQRGVVARQRRLRVGAGAEHDQPQPVVRPLVDEVAHHRLDRLPARRRPALRIAEILAVHGLRDIHDQQDVAHGLHVRERRLDPLRTRQRQRQQQPHGDVQPQLGPATLHARARGRLAGQRGHGVEKGRRNACRPCT